MAISLAACTPAAEQPAEVAVAETNISADRAAIEAIFEGIEQADVAEDIDALMALHTDDVISMPPNRPAIVGKEALQAYFERSFAVVDIVALEIGVEEIEIAGDLAYARGGFSETFVPGEGEEPVQFVGKLLFICRREPGGTWRLARLIANPDAPI